MKTALLIVTCLVLLCTACGQKVTQAEEPRLAIDKIRATFDDHLSKFGSVQGYTMDEALTDSDISEKTLDRWKFRVYGNPPASYVAISTDEHPLGAGHRVVYDVNKKSFEGWMTKQESDDD